MFNPIPIDFEMNLIADKWFFRMQEIEGLTQEQKTEKEKVWAIQDAADSISRAISSARYSRPRFLGIF